jgi:hypothetical protein
MRTHAPVLAALGLIAILTLGSASAATWDTKADLGLNLTQSSYSNHWTGGEAGSINWIANANLWLESQLSVKFNWSNTLKLSFGQTHIQDKDTKNWSKPQKSSDRIFFESVTKLTAGGLVDPYYSLTLESQFLDASNSQIDRYLNPITVNQAVGVSRTFIDTTLTKFTSRLGLALQHFSDNQIVDIENQEKNRRTTTSAGFTWVTDLDHTTPDERLNYVTKLRVFWAVANSKSDELENDYWKTPDVAWEHSVSASITSLLQVQLYLEFQYDKEISKVGRFKETLALGISYRLL